MYLFMTCKLIVLWTLYRQAKIFLRINSGEKYYDLLKKCCKLTKSNGLTKTEFTQTFT